MPTEEGKLMADHASRFELALPIKLGILAAGWALSASFIRQRRRMDFRGKSVVITGGSRGLGLELARGFAAEGANIALLARDRQELAGAKRELERLGVRIIDVGCDVTDYEQVRNAVASVAADLGIDVLINNAGIIQVGPYEHMEIKDFERAMATHFWGPLYLTLSAVSHMKHSRGGGRIVNIASIGGKIAVPHLLPYVASKFALVGLSEALRAELAKDRIYVTTVSPGLMRTGSHVNALFKGQYKKEFALFSIANAFPMLSVASDSAARQIIEACRYGIAQLVIGPQARFARFLNGLFPTLVGSALGIVARALPGPAASGGSRLRRGWQSRSALAPRLLTRPADRAASRNREILRPAPQLTAPAG
jgi:NAD(P)-dependent dehydrogenase (short-subunit alcohol dehydrogenase family)